jgi:predicted dehydrogenase
MRSSDEPVRFGLIGSGWITGVHLRALRAIPNEAVVLACADYPRARDRAGRGETFAASQSIARYYADYRAMLADPSIEAVTVALPNSVHAEVTIAALEAGKHAIVEKPLCFTLEEADHIVRLAREKNLYVGYAEELCYCPKLLRGKELAHRGAIGSVFLVKQVESHAGPYSEWFFDPALSGGGALMDMGCHSIEWARWMLDKAPIARVTANVSRYVHRDRAIDDHCLITMETNDGRAAICEAGWTLKGGMVSNAEIQGRDGVLKIDLLQSTGMDLFSVHGFAEEELMPGWSRPNTDWLFENGYPQEFSDFARAIREKRQPLENANDGRAVLEIIWAAYASAAEGRTIELPYAQPAGVPYPIAPWIAARRER